MFLVNNTNYISDLPEVGEISDRGGGDISPFLEVVVELVVELVVASLGTEIERMEVTTTKEEKTCLVSPGSHKDRHIRLQGNNSSHGEILGLHTVPVITSVVRMRNIMIIGHQVGELRETLSEMKSMKRDTTLIIIITITRIQHTEPVRIEDQNVDMPEADNLSDRVRGISEWLRPSDGLSRGRVTPGDGLTGTEAQVRGGERKPASMIWMMRICLKLVMPSPLIRKSSTQRITLTEANGNEAPVTITEVVRTTITMANIMRRAEDQ